MTQTNYKERLDELILRWWNGDYDKSFDELSAVIKSELTQLIKDLVAEAKPTKNRWHTNSEIALTQSCDICDQFEQNLLKLLEEK